MKTPYCPGRISSALVVLGPVLSSPLLHVTYSMSRPQYVSDLPLLLAGVPPLIEESLRLAGIPVKQFLVAAFLAKNAQSASGQYVIYDSNNASAQVEAKTAKFYGLTTIDIADLLMKIDNTDQKHVSPALRSSVGSRYLSRLKKRIEKLGGLWIRVSDYPFPYQSALCRGDVPLHAKISRWAEVLEKLPETSPSTELTWQTSYDEFDQWWKFREKISIRVRKQEACYHIQSDSDLLNYRPALEIWRGSHVASIPMERGDVTVREDGLVFRQQVERHSAGLAAMWFENMPRDHQPEQCRVKTA